jgi:hypothetical protein
VPGAERSAGSKDVTVKVALVCMPGD